MHRKVKKKNFPTCISPDYFLPICYFVLKSLWFGAFAMNIRNSKQFLSITAYFVASVRMVCALMRVCLSVQSASFYSFRSKTVRSPNQNHTVSIPRTYGFGTENIKSSYLKKRMQRVAEANATVWKREFNWLEKRRIRFVCIKSVSLCAFLKRNQSILFMYSNKEIWNVTYPIFLGLLAQNVINVTDTAFLGHVSEVALGASAMGGLLYICFYTVAFGFSVGSQILIARRNGEGNYHAIGPIMWQGSAFSFGMALVLLAAMYVFAEPLIRLLITSDNVYHATYEFFIWRIWGFLFAFVNVMFRALYIGITQGGQCGARLCVSVRRVGISRNGCARGCFGFGDSRGFFVGVLPYLYVYESRPAQICLAPLRAVRLEHGGAHPAHLQLHDGAVFSFDGYLVRVLHGTGAVGRTSVGHCQYREERLCGDADSGAVALYYRQYVGQQPYRVGRGGEGGAFAEPHRPDVILHHGGLRGVVRHFPSFHPFGLYQ